jgi:SNF2 family DNA or RNA helicase
MPSAQLTFDPDSQIVVVRASAQALMKDPLLAAYARAVGGGISGGEMSLPTTADSLAQRFQEVEKLLGRVGLELETEGETGEALHKVELEERAFHDFSKEAEAIWHSNFEPKAFEEFIRTIEAGSPGRRFYPRQLLSAFHLAFAQNACNFSVPGAGKTSIVYAAYLYLKSLPEDDIKHVDHLLVVGPLSSFKAWEDEYEGITERRPKSKRVAGFTPPAVRRDYLKGISFADRDTELTLTTYSTLANNEEEFRRFLGRSDRRVMMVLDEAHNIKREDGFWSAAALRLASSAAARVVLTGTPAPNGYEDLSNLFRFIYPTRNIIGFSPSTLKAMTAGALPKAIDRLKAQVRPFYTRIRKSDLGLPPTDELRDEVKLSAVHERIYSRIERLIMPQLRAAAQGGQSTLVRARLMRLRQAVVNPALLLRPLSEEGLLDEGAANAFSASELEVADLVAAFEPTSDLLRLQTLLGIVRKVVREQGKIVIWSYFLGNLQLLKDALGGEAQFVEIVTGATPVLSDLEEVSPEDLSTREAIIDRFHKDGETAILIANPQAVGESISLHKAASTAVYFDRDFNAGRFIQSKDRIHRYNPEPLGPVTYHYLLTPRTIDAVIDQRLAIKEARLLDLVESEEVPLFALLEDEAGDIAAILEDYERRKAN